MTNTVKEPVLQDRKGTAYRTVGQQVTLSIMSISDVEHAVHEQVLWGVRLPLKRAVRRQLLPWRPK